MQDAGSTDAPVPSWQMPRLQRAALTAAAVLATTLMAVDITIASVALPQVQGSFAVTPDQVAWMLSSYMIALAIATPAVGALVERFGRRRVFLAAVAGFTACSLLCGAALGFEQLVAFRFAKGVFAAALVPISQAVLLDSHPPEKHGTAMAWWTIGVMVGPILGPLLGGWLTEHWGWRWIFFVNLPFGLLAYVAIAAFLAESRRAAPRRFDALGYVALALAVAAVQFVLERGERADWFESTAILVAAGLALGAGWVFVVHSASAREPFIDGALFRDPNFVACLLVTFVTSGVFYANLSLFAPFLQNVLGYPADATGSMIAPRGVGVLLGVALANVLRRMLTDRAIVLLGLAGSAASIAAMTRFSLEVDAWTVTWTGTAQGFFYGVMFAPLTTATFATLEARLRTEGAALVQLVRQISGGAGIAIAFTLLARNARAYRAELGERLNAASPAWHGPVAGPDAALLDAQLRRQAEMLAYLDDVALLALAIVVTLPLVLLIRVPPRAPTRLAPDAAA